MGYRILSVASEWFSYHGGLSSFNRSFCAAISSSGHEVFCLVPRAAQQEREDASRVGVTLVVPEPVPGLSDEALLCLGIELGFEPDIVIGHGHITGAVAAARVRQFHRGARRIHVLHTLPDEIEPFKDRQGEDAAQRAHRKQETETALSISASLAVAVGPRLHRQWSTYIGGAQNGVGVHRLTPGLADHKPVGSIPQANWCLLMGRLEDAELKGVGVAAAALGLISKDKQFRGQREVTLVLRGAETGTSKDLRNHVHKLAKCGIPCTIREYTHQEEQVREDIARSSVVLMPSQMEGFGLVGIEALAMGVPILISQRSGLGELLLELIDSDSSLEFARRFIVDVGDGNKKDAQRWASAIREVLLDRERAYRETAVLRAAILKADYWQRAVSDLFGVLKIPPRDPKSPPDTPPDLTQWAQEILEIDPGTAIVYSSSLLEREMERVVTSKEIAKPALPAQLYLELLSKEGLLDSTETDLAKRVLHLKNKAAHRSDATFTKDMAEEHMRLVEVLVRKLKGNNDTINPLLGASIEELARLIRTGAADANAEIDVACARMNAGELDVAIHLLGDLRKKRWDTLTPRERYRVAANTGHALERKGEFRKAAQHYMEAEQHQPQDEQARALEAIAYYHLDDKPKAYALAGEVVRDHPSCALAHAIRIRSAPCEVPLAQLESGVPEALREEVEILHALGWFALSSGDVVAAERFATKARRRYPDSVEIKDHHATVIVQIEGRARQANQPVNRAKLEEAVRNLTEGINKSRGHQDEARLRYNRAEAYDLLGQTEDADTDYRHAIDADKLEPDITRRFVLFLMRHDRTTSAIDALRKADRVKQDHTNRLMLAGLLGERKAPGDWDAAIALLRETIPQNPEPETRAAMVATLTQLLGLSKRHDEAIACLDGLDEGYLRAAAAGATRAMVLLRAGKKVEALAAARLAMQSLDADSPETDRMRVAEALGYAGAKAEALSIWKQILKPDSADLFVRTALEFARETGDDAFIRDFCRGLRTRGVRHPFTMELEVMTLEKYSAYDDAVSVMQGYVAAHPDDDLTRVFRVRMSLLGVRLNRPELIEADVAKLPLVESAPVKIGAATAYILRNGPCPMRGVEYAYELVRRHFGDPLARQAYVAVVGVGDDEELFPLPPVAAPGCAVRYRADDTGEVSWVILEDSPGPSSDREEFGPESGRSEEMSGKAVGEKFDLRRGSLQDRTATIEFIGSKYKYRAVEIMQSWEERFPDRPFAQKFTVPTREDGSPDISLLLEALDEQERRKEVMHEIYRNNPISATTLAKFTNAGLLESLNHLASDGTLPIRCCRGAAGEQEVAAESLSGNTLIVIEPSALATLFFSGQFEQLKLLAGRCVICGGALEEYVELRQKFSSGSRGFVGKFKGLYQFREDDPPERERQVRRLDKFLSEIRPLVTIKSGESLADLPADKRDELIKLFGQPTAEAIAVAKAIGAALWTDDIAVAEIARQNFGIEKRVWSQAVFKLVAPPDVFADLTIFLLHWRYFFTRLEPQIVLAACRKGAWNPDDPGLVRVAEWIGMPELIPQGAVQLCAASLRLIWQEAVEVSQKQAVARLLLESVLGRQDGRQAVSFIRGGLREILQGDLAARRQCEAVIDEILRVKIGPGTESSKAAWGKVVRQIGQRSGYSGEAGRAQSGPSLGTAKPGGGPTPKERAEQRKKRKKRK